MKRPLPKPEYYELFELEQQYYLFNQLRQALKKAGAATENDVSKIKLNNILNSICMAYSLKCGTSKNWPIVENNRVYTFLNTSTPAYREQIIKAHQSQIKIPA